MTIQEGLIWTYYDCSHICYLFGKYELPCFLRTSSKLLLMFLILGLIIIIYKYIKYQKSKKNGLYEKEVKK